MKKTILLSFILFSLTFISCGSTSHSHETKDLFFTETDSFTGNSFTYFKKPIRNPFTVYLGENKDAKWLRITFQYTGSSWIFFKKAMIKNDDNEIMSFEIPYFEKKTEVLSSGVREFIDLFLTPEDAETLENILAKDNVIVRLSGDYYKDYKIKKNVCDGYIELIEKSK